jgi:hypothetical protein
MIKMSEGRWSNSEIATVGVLSAKWPKTETSYWSALNESVENLRSMLSLLNDRFESIDKDSDLSPSGRNKRRVEMAQQALKELADYEPQRKAESAVARRIENLKAKLTTLPSPTSQADLHLAAEIRATIRAHKEPETFALSLRSDSRAMAAVLAGPAFLSGLNDEGLQRLRDAALRSLHPAELLEIEELQNAEKHARESVKLAAHRIAKRAGMVEGVNGWHHTSEAPPAKPAAAKPAA